MIQGKIPKALVERAYQYSDLTRGIVAYTINKIN